MKWVHLPCELLWTKITPTLHATPHCAPVTVPSGGEVFSFHPPWFWPMRTWETRIRKRKYTGLVVSACFLLEPTLCCEEAWERIPRRRNGIVGPQCDWWTHTEYFSPVVGSVPPEAPLTPAGLRLICWPTKPGALSIIWKIPWMEEPCRLQSMGSQRVRHYWATSLSLWLR